MPTTEEYAAYMRRVGSALGPFMRRTCVRMLAMSSPDDDAPLRPQGTASLFSIAGIHFLVTAAHLFEDGDWLWVENHVSEPPTKFRPLGGPLPIVADDVAIIHLQEDVVEAFAGTTTSTVRGARTTRNGR